MPARRGVEALKCTPEDSEELADEFPLLVGLCTADEGGDKREVMAHSPGRSNSCRHRRRRVGVYVRTRRDRDRRLRALRLSQPPLRAA